MLTRLKPISAGAQRRGVETQYCVPHIDKANVRSYDYSALLYLNTKGHSFEGGDFCFVDATGDQDQPHTACDSDTCQHPIAPAFAVIDPDNCPENGAIGDESLWGADPYATSEVDIALSLDESDELLLEYLAMTEEDD